MTLNFTFDGESLPFNSGETILHAVLAAGRYIPHLCYHPEFTPHGSCKLCTVQANGRYVSACTTPLTADMAVACQTPELNNQRRELLRMLFVEGNHFCPGCEKSGNCQLQALAYDAEMMSPHYNHFYPARPVDASHPEYFLDFNRCIMCELCVRASRDVDGKNIFKLVGRGIKSHIVVNTASGKLGDTTFAATDKAADICPVGVILKKGVGYALPIGQRKYDVLPIHAQPNVQNAQSIVQPDFQSQTQPDVRSQTQPNSGSLASEGSHS